MVLHLHAVIFRKVKDEIKKNLHILSGIMIMIMINDNRVRKNYFLLAVKRLN